MTTYCIWIYLKLIFVSFIFHSSFNLVGLTADVQGVTACHINLTWREPSVVPFGLLETLNASLTQTTYADVAVSITYH